MLIKKGHAIILRELRSYRNVSNLIAREVIERSRFSRRIKELYIMGLLKKRNGEIELTEAGMHLLNAVEKVDIDEVPDPWIDSRIIEILDLVMTTGHLPDPWTRLLEERGLWRDGELSEAGREIYNAYSKARTLIYITPEIAEFLLSMPPGPAPYDELVRHKDAGGYSTHIINALEATRLLKVSPPTKEGSIYMLTPLGRRVRKALFKIPIYDSVILIDERIVDAFLKSERSVAEETELKTMHLIGSNGEPTEAGHELTAGYRESRALQVRVASLSISLEEISVLKAISKLINRLPDRPYPTLDDIAKNLSNGGKVGILLHLLESKELVMRYEYKGKDTYKVIELGEAVLKKLSNVDRNITSSATKAVNYALVGRTPKPEWVSEARRLGLIHNDITGRGWFLLELSARVIRKPILTRYDALIIQKVPSKGVMVKELANWLVDEGVDEKSVEYALSECESKGYVEVLPNDYITLTEVGSLMKEVVTSAVTKELIQSEISITPTLYNVLCIIEKNLPELKKVWAKGDGRKLINEEARIIYNNLKNIVSITLDEVVKAVIQLRGYGLLGRAGITGAGRKLLEVGIKLRNYIVDLSLIKVYK
ncbi:MAG: DUF505 family protein [Desulfurococcales archaeon]|nr:DUF505 family protein [Desulfurococcales archaeon]